MEIYSYVITHDSGFAPNPFGGFLTLATCKPKIRSSAKVGDIVVGTGSAKTVGNGKLVYAGIVSKVIPIEEYGIDKTYEIKRPSTKGEWWKKHGDNIYYRDGNKWKQRRNLHHFEHDIRHDIDGRNVLICEEFWYYGADAIEIPSHLLIIVKKGPAHKRIQDKNLVQGFYRWLICNKKGICGNPEMEPTSGCNRTTNRC